MDEVVISRGERERLFIELRFPPCDPTNAADATRGALRLYVGHHRIWFGSVQGHGFEWTWVELLEFLSTVWPWLTLEEGLPFDWTPAKLAHVRFKARDEAQDLDERKREEFEDALGDFEQTHDLALALQGVVLPSVWIVNEGNVSWVLTDTQCIEIGRETCRHLLSELGEVIASRLTRLEDPRSKRAVDDWQARERIDNEKRLAIATGLTSVELAQVYNLVEPRVARQLSLDDVIEGELAAAARLGAPLGTEIVAQLMAEISKVPAGDTRHLDQLSSMARAQLPSRSNPSSEGYILAQWLRQQAGVVSESGRVDPRRLAETWGVIVEEVDVEAPSLDAFACWGRRHGPAIFINGQGQHNGTVGGRNATLAHELAHLLVDRDSTLPAVEVLGGRAIRRIEQRARAFAAELLLPREIAGARFASGGPANEIVKTLQADYRVSKELIAWQARNWEKSRDIPPDSLNHLRTLVSEPWRF